jgi:epoxyqueuosine reductase
MEATELSANLLNAIEQEGCRAKIVSVEHLRDLRGDINTLHQQGYFDEEFFTEELSGFDFTVADRLAGAKSLIIAAAPQPQVRVTFVAEGQELPYIIPPTYSYATDRRMAELIRLQLEPAGYHFKKAIIPWKLLAVRSGLARYGKNNITYIAGLGSFYRLVAFVTDLPCAEDSWGELNILKDCTKCDACAKACPGGAIGAGRFLLHAERCITFHNERQGEFPVWLNPSWHHCLVGCMVCQKVCPADKTFRKWIVEGPRFSAEETACLRHGVNQDKLVTETLPKLNQLDMVEYVDVLGRNLEAMISKRAS